MGSAQRAQRFEFHLFGAGEVYNPYAHSFAEFLQADLAAACESYGIAVSVHRR